MAPLSLTLWGCGIILVFWGMVVTVLGGAGWLLVTGLRWLVGGAG